MNRSRATKRNIVRALSAVLMLAALSGFTSPEQVTIVDPAGKTLSMMEVPGSLSVNVNVKLSSTQGALDGISVTMTQGEKTQSAQANAAGVASFENIQAGTYTVATSGAASIADVAIIKRGNAPASVSSNGKTEDKSLALSRSMYVVGASAVAGGVALLGNGSSNGGSSVEREGSASASLGGSSDAGSTVGTIGDVRIGPSFDPNRPDLTGTPSPAPSPIVAGDPVNPQGLESPTFTTAPVVVTPGPLSPS